MFTTTTPAHRPTPESFGRILAKGGLGGRRTVPLRRGGGGLRAGLGHRARLRAPPAERARPGRGVRPDASAAGTGSEFEMEGLG